MSELRAFSKACAVPWAILPDTLQLILEIASREHLPDFEAVEARRARRLDGAESVRIREGGVAVLSISGPIFRYADFFTEFSGGATISSLAKDFNAALNDPNVNSILLNIDSPGGEVSGVNEFAQMVFDARNRKPIIAYVDGLGASAAYWIASAAEEIVADDTAMIGSIGVVAAVPDPAKRSARDVQFVSSQSPKKRPDPNTESGKGQIQALVDDLADVFIANVARNRSVSAETVMSEFGQGGVMVGQKAITAGLADRLGSFESLVAEMAAGNFRKRKSKKYAAEAEEIAAEGETEMAEKTILERIRGIMDGHDKVTAEKPVAEEFIAVTGTLLQSPSAQELERIEAENHAMRKELKAQREAKETADAESFVTAQITAGKMFPSEQISAMALYMYCAADDRERPLDIGSRVGSLRAMIEARPTSKLTQELTVATADKVLKADENGQTELTEERRKQLLEQTPLGKATLKAV